MLNSLSRTKSAQRVAPSSTSSIGSKKPPSNQQKNTLGKILKCFQFTSKESLKPTRVYPEGNQPTKPLSEETKFEPNNTSSIDSQDNSSVSTENTTNQTDSTKSLLQETDSAVSSANKETKFVDQKKSDIKKVVNLYLSSEKFSKLPMTDQNLAQFIQGEANKGDHLNDTSVSAADIDQAKEIHRDMLLANNARKDDMGILSSIGKMLSFSKTPVRAERVTQTLKSSSANVINEMANDIKEMYKDNNSATKVLENIINITGDGKSTLTEALSNKFEALLKKDQSFDAMIANDKLFNRMENHTNYSATELATIEKDLGIEKEMDDLVSQYSGVQDKEIGAMVVHGALGNIPGGDVAIKMAHIDNARDEKANLGTYKSDVLQNIPQFSESVSVGGICLRSVGDIMVKTPIRAVLKPVTMILDGLSGLGAGLRQLSSGGLKGFRSSMKNAGFTRKTAVRSAIQLFRNMRHEKVGQLFKPPSKEQQLIKDINYTRKELSQTFEPTKREELLGKLTDYKDQLEGEINNQESSLNQEIDDYNKGKKEAEKLSKDINGLNKNLDVLGGKDIEQSNVVKEAESKIDKFANEGEAVVKELDKAVTSTVANGIRRSFDSNLRSLSTGLKYAGDTLKYMTSTLSESEKKLADIDQKIEQKNQLEVKKNLLNKLESGIEKLKNSNQLANTPISVAIEDALTSPNLTPETRQVLNDIKSNSEYYDTNLVSEDVINNLQNDTGSKESSNEVASFIKKNQTFGLLRQKDDMVLNGCTAHVVTEYASSAGAGHAGGHVARAMHRVVRPLTKMLFKSAIHYTTSASNTQQYNINQKAGEVANELHKAEANVLDGLNSGWMANEKNPMSDDEKTLLKDFISVKQDIDTAMSGKDLNSARQTIDAKKDDYNKLLTKLKNNKKVMSKYQSLIAKQLPENGEIKDLCDSFERGLLANDPSGSGFADTLLLPKHRTTWAVKKFAASNIH